MLLSIFYLFILTKVYLWKQNLMETVFKTPELYYSATGCNLQAQNFATRGFLHISFVDEFAEAFEEKLIFQSRSSGRVIFAKIKDHKDLFQT